MRRHLDGIPCAVAQGQGWANVPGIGEVDVVQRNVALIKHWRAQRLQIQLLAGAGVQCLPLIYDAGYLIVILIPGSSVAIAGEANLRAWYVHWKVAIRDAGGISTDLVDVRRHDAATVVIALVVVPLVGILAPKLEQMVTVDHRNVVAEGMADAVPEPRAHILRVHVIRNQRARVGFAAYLERAI